MHRTHAATSRIRRRSGLALIAALTAASLLLAACSPSAPAKPAATGRPDQNATLTVGLVLEPTSLDIRHTAGAALEQVLVDNIYEGLVSRTQDDRIVDRLAKSHEVSADGLTYTFVLHDGIAFHDGAALTAADVVSSLQTAKDDATVQGHADLAGVASITAKDDKTVVVTLAAPSQNFLFSLTGHAGLIFQKGGPTDLQSAENGTGPFTLQKWNKGSSLTFARNDKYWGEKAGVKTIVFDYIPDFTAGVNAALDGTLDVLTAVDPNLAPQLDKGGRFALTTGRTTDKGTLAFNNTRAPLNDQRVREALRLAIDHKAIIAARGAGTTMYGPIPQLDPGYKDLSSTAPYDPEKAKTLLKSAGQENLTLTLTIPSFYGSTVPQLLTSDFKKVGVTLKVNSVEFPAWLDTVFTKHDYDLSFVLHVEPRDFGNFANPKYYFGYDNPQVQKLYTQSQTELDPKKSADLLSQAAEIVAKDAAADWLYEDQTITAVRPGVDGFPQDSINSRLDLHGVTVTK
ncbi:ABC transporter substrate-binding protein [Microbacterium capsulatum]|uniref:ABC transporter substrate-binding protein n=1 Tax=Microbacterium capsulatum TaxID=3041921 RepID=A0ABU0XF49_9MICO|nr:ABC transporter substrate-binding protein [Microbacterium sp. ASV81]MDQ4212315.1 ABC transporter substrate-binding protein [Microbacterium sp. ASV81]